MTNELKTDGSARGAESRMGEREPMIGRDPVVGLGPHGEFPAAAEQVRVSEEDADRAIERQFNVAVVVHTAGSDWSRQQLAGIAATLGRFNAAIVEVVDCDFAVERQIEALHDLARRRPDGVISIPVDNVRTADAHLAVAEAGVRLVLMDNAPAGMVPGKHYVSVVSADNFGNGQIAAEILSHEVPEGETVGIVGFAADFFVTNEREIAFRKWMKDRRPDVTLRHMQFADTADAGPAAARLIAAEPRLGGMFVVWDEPATLVIEEIRRSGRRVPLTTIDLGNEVALELARGDIVKGVGAQRPYDQGVVEATAMILALVGREPPAWIALPSLRVTRSNLLAAYQAVWHTPAPAELRRAIDVGV